MFYQGDILSPLWNYLKSIPKGLQEAKYEDRGVETWATN